MKKKKVQNIGAIGATLGNVAGLVYAFKGKKKFWGYVGFMLLGGLVVGGLASVGANIAIKEDKSTVVGLGNPKSE